MFGHPGSISISQNTHDMEHPVLTSQGLDSCNYVTSLHSRKNDSSYLIIPHQDFFTTGSLSFQMHFIYYFSFYAL